MPRSWRFLPILRCPSAVVLSLVLALAPPAMPETSSSPRAEGGLSILSEPAGAAVYLNGQSKGVTPLQIDRLASGDHRMTLAKEGYLDNSRVITVEAGRTRALQVKLTRLVPSAHATQVDTDAERGGGLGVWKYVIPAVAGGGVAAYLLLRDTNEAPSPGSVNVSPQGPALAAVTSLSFTAQGASDPDGDSLTFAWDFGDGEAGSGQTVTHVYGGAGTFTVKVTVSDGKKSATASASVTVKSLTGTWAGDLLPRTTTFFTFTLTQNGVTLTGTYSDPVNGSGPVSGDVSAPQRVSLRTNVPGFRTGFWTGTLDSSLDRIDGTVDWFEGGLQSFFLNRR